MAIHICVLPLLPSAHLPVQVCGRETPLALAVCVCVFVCVCVCGCVCACVCASVRVQLPKKKTNKIATRGNKRALQKTILEKILFKMHREPTKILDKK